jgi:hypothetical protein
VDRSVNGNDLAAQVARPFGAVLATGVVLVKRVRRPRPLHPQGVLLQGTLTRTGDGPPSGIAWVDVPGVSPVLARLSRSAGLPRALPDVLGLALRCHTDGNPVDLLMASTGTGTITRWVPTLHRELTGATVSTIIPLRGTTGPVLLAGVLNWDQELSADLRGLATATPAYLLTVTLLHATHRGPWHTFGHATVHHPGTDTHASQTGSTDTRVRFDAVRNPPPGSTVDDWARTLREPSYAAARQP